MKKELIMRCLVLASVMMIALPVSSQTNKRIANKVAGQVNQISREAGISTRVSSDGSGLDAIDRAYERSLKKERIKELQRSGVTIENANSKRRVASSSSIGGASRSIVRYGSSSSGDYSSSSSTSKSDESNLRYTKEAERDLQRSAEIDAMMQEYIAEGANWRPRQNVNDIIAQSRGGAVGNKDDGVEPDEGKPKGINVSPLEGIKMDDKDKKEEAKEDDEYARKMQAYYDKFVEDEDSLTDEQLDELEAYLTQLENKKKNSTK